MARALCALFVAMLFYSQSLASDHIHDLDQNAPSQEVCQNCLAATSDDKDAFSAKHDPSDSPVFMSAPQPVGVAAGLLASRVDPKETGYRPPREPDRRADAPRAPPF